MDIIKQYQFVRDSEIRFHSVQNQFWSHGDTKVGERVISLIGLCENGPLVEEEQKLEPSEVAENRQKRNKTKKVSKKTEIKNNIAG